MSIKFKQNLPSILMLLFGIFLLILIPYQVSGVKITSLGPKFLPYLVAIGITILSLLSVIEGFLNKESIGEEADRETKENKSYIRTILTLLSLVIWLLLVPIIGFVITTIAFIATIIVIIGEYKIYQLIIIPLVVAFSVYYIFNNILNVILPEGIFF